MKFRTFWLPLLLCAAILAGCYFSPELFRRVVPDPLTEAEPVEIGGRDSGLYLERTSQLPLPPWDTLEAAENNASYPLSDPEPWFSCLPVWLALYDGLSVSDLQFSGPALIHLSLDDAIYFQRGIGLRLSSGTNAADMEAESFPYEGRVPPEMPYGAQVELGTPSAGTLEISCTEADGADYLLDLASAEPYSDGVPPLSLHLSVPGAPAEPYDGDPERLIDAVRDAAVLLTYFTVGDADMWLNEHGYPFWPEMLRLYPREAIDVLPEIMDACAPVSQSSEALALLHFFAVAYGLWDVDSDACASMLEQCAVTVEEYNGETLLVFTRRSEERFLLYYDGARDRVTGFSMTQAFYRRLFP